MLAATNAYDVGVAVIVGLPATIGAVAGVFAWSAARKAKQTSSLVAAEVRSPNGEPTAYAVYEIRKQMIGLTEGMSELRVGQQVTHRRLDEVEAMQVRHNADDDERFAALHRRLDLGT